MRSAQENLAMYMAMAGIMGGGMGGLDTMIQHEVSRRFPKDKHGRRNYRYPKENGGEFIILALNKESADEQYAKIIQKKKCRGYWKFTADSDEMAQQVFDNIGFARLDVVCNGLTGNGRVFMIKIPAGENAMRIKYRIIGATDLLNESGNWEFVFEAQLEKLQEV